MLRILFLTVLTGVITFLTLLVISQENFGYLLLIGPLALVYLIFELLEGDKK